MSAETYTTILDNIAAAFNAETPALLVEVSYGQGLGADEQQDIVSAQGFRNVLIKVDDTPQADVHNATFGGIQEGRAMMWSIAPSDRAALDALKTWWLTICGDSGNILHNVKTQTTLGTLDFMRWRAVGGFQGFASKYGNLWLVDQLVEYTVKTQGA
jgi:hypothetical protein